MFNFLQDYLLNRIINVYYRFKFLRRIIAKRNDFMGQIIDFPQSLSIVALTVFKAFLKTIQFECRLQNFIHLIFRNHVLFLNVVFCSGAVGLHQIYA